MSLSHVHNRGISSSQYCADMESLKHTENTVLEVTDWLTGWNLLSHISYLTCLYFGHGIWAHFDS